MRVDHLLTGRPCEDREASVLRGHQRKSITLIVNKLRGGEVPRAAVLRRMDHYR